ncbi:MAG: transcriptional regulator [Rhizobiaceae bacterium]|nr:transcriptional regulator [Rhizobiaceae bacterium]
MAESENTAFLTELTSEIVAAYVSNNPIAAAQLPELITSTFQTVSSLTATANSTEPEQKDPAVSVKKSIRDDHLVCLEGGKKFKSLKRHLMSHHGLTPDEYRARWNLRSEYPMVAPAYAERRSKLAKEIGLGRKPKGS